MRPGVGVFTRDHIVIGLLNRHSLRYQQALECPGRFQQGYGAVLPEADILPHYLASPWIDARVGQRYPECCAISVVKRNRPSLDQAPIQLIEAGPDGIWEESQPLGQSGYDHNGRQHQAGRSDSNRFQRRGAAVE